MPYFDLEILYATYFLKCWYIFLNTYFYEWNFKNKNKIAISFYEHQTHKSYINGN
jgi:hypothetical protein